MRNLFATVYFYCVLPNGEDCDCEFEVVVLDDYSGDFTLQSVNALNFPDKFEMFVYDQWTKEEGGIDNVCGWDWDLYVD